jgi:PAS domain S-box-containing protein
MDHLTLEHEIATELNPFSTGVSVGAAPTMRRETILMMLSQAAQLAQHPSELLQEAGFLSAAVSEVQLFAGATFHGEKLFVTFGSVSNSSLSGNAAHEIPCDPQRSSFHFAVETGHPIVIANVATETRFRDTVLIERGIRAGVVCPIDYRDQHYGVIAVFSPDMRQFSKDDVLFLRSVAMFLGPALAYQKSEQCLAEHTHFVSAAIDSLDAIVLLLSADGSVLQINRACQNIGGFTVAELRGRRIWSAFWQNDESASAESAVTELRNGAKQVKREAFFVSKQGAVRRVSWTFANLHEEHTTGPAILATGLDITDQYPSIKTLEDVSSGVHSKNSDVLADKLHPKLDPASAKSDSHEGRKHDRRPYQCIQMVAPCIDGKLPELDQFREVRCYDISPGGFSFLLATRPNFDELVAAFGAESSRLYLRARIKHISPIQFEGHKVLLIGCEYLGRIRMPTAQS